jgi:hypothetical protein
MQTGGLGSVIGGAGADPKMPFLCGPVYGSNALCARMRPKAERDVRTARGGVIEPAFDATEGRCCALGGEMNTMPSNSSTEVPAEHRISVCVALRVAAPNRPVLRAKPFPVAGPRCARLEIARRRGGGAADRA